MENLKKSMKYSIVFGLIGALLVPVFYEIYANISGAVSIVLMLIWVIFVGVKFSSFSFKEAFVGITCDIAYSGILGFICYLIIHPLTQKLLSKGSVYFQLSLKQTAVFVGYTFVIFLCMYIVWLIRLGLNAAFNQFKKNSDKAGEYIDNAFDDSKEDLK